MYLCANKTPRTTHKNKMKASNAAPVLGQLNPVERMYGQMVTDLRSCIELKYGTLRDFAKIVQGAGESMQEANLYRVLANKSPQRMSLELYVRICGLLGIGGERMRCQRIGASNISLIDYLMIDNDAILKSFMQLQYQDYQS